MEHSTLKDFRPGVLSHQSELSGAEVNDGELKLEAVRQMLSSLRKTVSFEP